MRKFWVMVVAAVVAATCAGVAPAAQADEQPAGQLVRDVPAPNTPHMLNGRVNSIAQVGGTIVLGGTFTQARNYDSQVVQSQPYLVAFNATTGEISQTFKPQVNGAVYKVLDAGDGQTVYVGGQFSGIGGTSRNRVARIRISDGSVVQTFNAGTVSGTVRDMAMSDGRLWVGGVFTHIANGRQKALAALSPTTGARLPFMQLLVDGFHRRGNTQVLALDISPDGDRLVAIGNFSTLEGAPTPQLLVLDLTGATAQPATWQTNFYTDPCSSSFDTVMRDVSMSPDGQYFAVVTTGAYAGASSSCDSIARFEVGADGADQKPSWVNMTGGDTTTGVLATDSSVYIGGHFRWNNNPFRGDTAGQGAVAREGLSALDPINGLPFTWNPGRTKGVGVFDFMNTTQGLWIASDTDRISNFNYRGRIALMGPDGVTYPSVKTPQVPNDVYGASASAGPGSDVLARRRITPTGVDQPVQLPSGIVNWSTIRGSFMINGDLYFATSDGAFTRRTFDGVNYGDAQPVNGADQVVALTDWRTDISNATGMFYDRGRIYFTRSGDSSLYYRYFTPQSGMVGARRFVASPSVAGLNFNAVRGMFTDGSTLYWADAAGNLNATDWVNNPINGHPVAGTTQVRSGPGAGDGQVWNNRSYFLYQDAAGNGAVTAPPVLPTAAFTSNCVGLTCSFDGSSSSVATGQIDSYDWNFDGVASGTGESAQFTFQSAGTKLVSLTVTTAAGATHTVTNQVIVNTPVAGSPEFVAAASSNANSNNHRVTVPASVQVGDTMVLAGTFNTTRSVLSAPAGWTELHASDIGTVGQARLWTRRASAADAGSQVAVPGTSYAKGDLALSVYRSTGGQTKVLTSAMTVITGAGTGLVAPDLTTTAPAIVVTYWGAKSSGDVGWAAPGGVTQRTLTEGSGGGHVAGLLVDTGSAVPAGTLVGATGSAATSVTKGVMFAVAVGME